MRSKCYRWNEFTCVNAAVKGNLDIIQWLRSQDPPCPWNEKTCEATIVNGHLKTLQWVISQGCPLSKKMCDFAVIHENLTMLQWLRMQNPPCPWDEDTCSYAALGMDEFFLNF